MQLHDLFFTPVYFILILLFAHQIRPRVTNQETEKYFLPALSLKMLGAIGLGLIYTFHYRGGDTINFFNDAIRLSENIWTDTSNTLRVLFRIDHVIDDSFLRIRKGIWYYKDPPSYFIVQIITIINLFCFDSYGAVSVVFGALSFSGVWLLYYSFCLLKTHLYKVFAYIVLFLPSMIFWGSGILKDSITLGAMGWLFWSCYNMIYQKVTPMYLLLGFISSFILIKVKIYVILCFLPVATYWFFLEKTNFKNKNIKYFARPFALVIGLAISFLALQKLSESSDKYNFDNITRTATVTANWLSHVSKTQGGSGYQLSGTFDGSLSSFFSLAPQALNVTYFRPYLWEARNPVMLLAAIESLLCLLIFMWTFVLLLKNGFRQIFKAPSFVIISFIFAALFGIAIGISTYNFGSLVRYKLPALPFFLCSLIVIIDMRSNFFKKF